VDAGDFNLSCDSSPVGMDPRAFARLTAYDIPIPRDAMIDPCWPELLADIADRIGAYEALLIVDAFAGRELYIPLDPLRSPFVGLIRMKSVIAMANAYGRERLPIPTGSETILKAKRQGIIASIRAGGLNVVQGARILRMARRHVSRLVNQTDEGVGYEPIKLPEPRILVALREAALIAANALRDAGAAFDVVEATSTKIVDIFFRDPTAPDELALMRTEE